MSEVLTGPGEQLGPERLQGIAAIAGGAPAAGPAWVAERLEAGMSREASRAVWLEAMRRPGLLVPQLTGRRTRTRLTTVVRISARRGAPVPLVASPAQ